MPDSTVLLSKPLRFAQAYHGAFNIFHYFTKCSLYLVPLDDMRIWMPLVPYTYDVSPVDFERYFAKKNKRDNYNLEMFEKVRREKATQIGKLGIFHDFFAPVVSKGKCIAVLVSGLIQKKVPNRQELEQHWMELSGNRPDPNDVLFRRFVSSCLQLTILPEPLFHSHMALMEIIARLVAGYGKPDQHVRKVEDMKNRVFAPRLPHAYWMHSLLVRPNNSGLSYWKEGKLSEWERKEIGVHKVPSTVMAVIPYDTKESKPDPVDVLIRAKHLQQSAVSLAKCFPDTAAGPLEDYGALFLTSFPTRKARNTMRMEISDRARKIVTSLEKAVTSPMAIGVGRTVGKGDHLAPSYEDAMQALQWGTYLGKNVLFHDELPQKNVTLGAVDFRFSSRRLVEAIARGHRAGLALALDQFMKKILWFSGERPEVIRLLFLNVLSEAMEALERRMALDSEAFCGEFLALEAKFQKAYSIFDLAALFKETIESFLKISQRPLRGALGFGIERIKAFVERNHQQSLTLQNTAGKFEVSAKALGRKFKEQTGKSFNDFLLHLRAEEAKKLLRTTQLKMSAIAQDCGFSSTSYFVRSFKKAVGTTPMNYRRQS